MIFMCKYSNEMMRSIKALEFKYFNDIDNEWFI